MKRRNMRRCGVFNGARQLYIQLHCSLINMCGQNGSDSILFIIFSGAMKSAMRCYRWLPILHARYAPKGSPSPGL